MIAQLLAAKGPGEGAQAGHLALKSGRRRAGTTIAPLGQFGHKLPQLMRRELQGREVVPVQELAELLQVRPVRLKRVSRKPALKLEVTEEVEHEIGEPSRRGRGGHARYFGLGVGGPADSRGGLRRPGRQPEQRDERLGVLALCDRVVQPVKRPADHLDPLVLVRRRLRRGAQFLGQVQPHPLVRKTRAGVEHEQLGPARRLLPDLQRLQEQDEHFAALSARIIRMLRRADALSGHVPLDSRDLRGWHMVITSGLLLHVSPHGFDEGMNGRYAFVQDTPELCLEGIERVKAVLAALEIAPPRIFALPERSSSILAQATARILDCPLESWPDGGSEEPGLIVAYDLALLDVDDDPSRM